MLEEEDIRYFSVAGRRKSQTLEAAAFKVNWNGVLEASTTSNLSESMNIRG